MVFILADNQDITRIGLETVCKKFAGIEVRCVSNKTELISVLQCEEEAAVVLDYALFDFEDVNAVTVTHLRFPHVQWILFSDELADDFVRRIVAEGGAFSIVNKNSGVTEIEEALRLALHHERYLCRLSTEQLLSLSAHDEGKSVVLTKTEIEILKRIAAGKTTKEIAAERCSSFHTVNTHRKNIFRKLDVNTAYEATKYALRAGLIDAADYYI